MKPKLPNAKAGSALDPGRFMRRIVYRQRCDANFRIQYTFFDLDLDSPLASMRFSRSLDFVFIVLQLSFASQLNFSLQPQTRPARPSPSLRFPWVLGRRLLYGVSNTASFSSGAFYGESRFWRVTPRTKRPFRTAGRSSVTRGNFRTKTTGFGPFFVTFGRNILYSTLEFISPGSSKSNAEIATNLFGLLLRTGAPTLFLPFPLTPAASRIYDRGRLSSADPNTAYAAIPGAATQNVLETTPIFLFRPNKLKIAVGWKAKSSKLRDIEMKHALEGLWNGTLRDRGPDGMENNNGASEYIPRLIIYSPSSSRVLFLLVFEVAETHRFYMLDLPSLSGALEEKKRREHDMLHRRSDRTYPDIALCADRKALTTSATEVLRDSEAPSFMKPSANGPTRLLAWSSSPSCALSSPGAPIPSTLNFDVREARDSVRAYIQVDEILHESKIQDFGSDVVILREKETRSSVEVIDERTRTNTGSGVKGETQKQSKIPSAKSEKGEIPRRREQNQRTRNRTGKAGCKEARDEEGEHAPRMTSESAEQDTGASREIKSLSRHWRRMRFAATR
ncbi:hypothetical protein K438DRAFT_1769014 [Mycena galopus ATCC 62051]|nr:hypothetical protein K438DRAFT_1769014 [Mycena galopus ATCC 62051]